MAGAAVVAAMVLGALGPADADASVATVRPGPGAFEVFHIPGYELAYVAAPGERNRVVIRSAYAGSPWTVSDAGAVIEPGPGCTAVDAHAVRCTAASSGPPGFPASVVALADARLGDLDDEVEFLEPDAGARFRLLADGGAGNDRLSGAAGGGELRGGPGDDRLAGMTRPYESAVLDGGGGRDVLRGGQGDDTLTDGDLDDAVGDAAPGPDVLDGGGGADTVSYRQRAAPVTVGLADSKADGAPGEGDLLRDMESIAGGQGSDRLAGDRGPNLIDGQDGRDVLIGRGGRDEFVNGRGPISCGPGDDLVRLPRSTDLLDPTCEKVAPRPAGYGEPGFAAYPTIRRAGKPRYRVHCRRDDDTGEVHPCSGAVTIARAGATRRLARGAFPRGRWTDRRVDLTLTPLGRRLAAARRGVPAVVTVRINGAALRWGIRFRLPR